MKIIGKLFHQKNQWLLCKAIAKKTQRLADLKVKNPESFRLRSAENELQWLKNKNNLINKARVRNTHRAIRQLERQLGLVPGADTYGI